MAQDGSRTARFHRREEAAFRGDVAVTHGVNTPVKEVQVPARHHALNLLGAQAALDELGAGDDAPLPRRELRKDPDGVGGRFASHSDFN